MYPQVVFNHDIVIPVELALTPDSRAVGLMFRKYLPPGTGMLFVFPDIAERSFWMANVKIPLDMVFMTLSRVCGLYENAVPGSTDPVDSHCPAQYVLELNAGEIAAFGVQIGQSVIMVDVPDVST